MISWWASLLLLGGLAVTDLGEAQPALARLNAIRAQAGLGPVALDAAMSRASMRHAVYLALNEGTAATAGLRAHHEVPGLPGYSVEGAEAGSLANLAHVPPTEAVDAWTTGLYHRRPLMAPGLARVGIAGVRGPKGYRAVLMVGRYPVPDTAYPPVRWPADGQADAPVDFACGEQPDPVPGGRARQSGYPITLHFHPDTVLTGVAATLVDGAGRPVPFHLSSPERPAIAGRPQPGTVCLIPVRPLAPGTPYRVGVTASGQTWRWGFTTTRTPRAPRTYLPVPAAWYAGTVGTAFTARGMAGTAYALEVRGAGKPVIVLVSDPLAAGLRARGFASGEAFKGKRIQAYGEASSAGMVHATEIRVP